MDSLILKKVNHIFNKDDISKTSDIIEDFNGCSRKLDFDKESFSIVYISYFNDKKHTYFMLQSDIKLTHNGKCVPMCLVKVSLGNYMNYCFLNNFIRPTSYEREIYKEYDLDEYVERTEALQEITNIEGNIDIYNFPEILEGIQKKYKEKLYQAFLTMPNHPIFKDLLSDFVEN